MTLALGIFAALLEPLCSASGLMLWDKKWTGHAVMLNLLKCSVTAAGLAATIAVIIFFDIRGGALDGAGTKGESRADVLFGGQVPPPVWLYLASSAILGIMIGDSCWLLSLKQLRARRLIVVCALKPFAATALATVMLGEWGVLYSWRFVFGLLMTISGVTWTALELESGQEQQEGLLTDSASPRTASGILTRGYIFATLYILSDTFSSVLIKEHSAQLNSIEITCARDTVASIALGIPVLVAHAMIAVKKSPVNEVGPWRWYEVPQNISSRDWLFIITAVFLVTFLVPILFVYAFFQMPMGMAQALDSIGPLYSIPLVYLIKGEVVSRRGILGAVVTVAGVFLLSWGAMAGAG